MTFQRNFRFIRRLNMILQSESLHMKSTNTTNTKDITGSYPSVQEDKVSRENFVPAKKLYYYRERRKSSKNQLTTPSTNRRLQLRSQEVKNRRNRYNELNRKVNYRKYKMELTRIRNGKK